MKVCSIREMRSLDLLAESEFGLSGIVLMENAGLAACQVLRNEFQTRNSRYRVLCGNGRSAAVGFVLARHLLSRGADVAVFLIEAPDAYQGDALANYEAACRCGVSCLRLNQVDDLLRELQNDVVIVDALMDPSTAPQLSSDIARVIEVVNQSQGPVLSLDLPSGVCADTGQVLDAAVRASATLAFGLPKRGNVVAPGSSHVGRLFVSHLSLPPRLLAADDVEVELTRPSRLPSRSPHGHKGSFGDTLFIAGAAGYFGAPGLAAMAALRAGGGYARLACPGSITPTLAAFAPEVVFVPQPETDTGSMARDHAESLIDLANQVDFVVIGPGLSLHSDTQELVRTIATHTRRPMLIDGDGLSAVAGHADLVRSRTADTVLTPHPGEMARILGTSVRQVTADPIASAIRAASLFGAEIVLKGAPCLVASPDGKVSINTSGNDGMGTAGSGDVLTGTIAAMHGLGLRFPSAVRTGVFLHGVAGDRARDDLGADGMTARDILSHLPDAIREYRGRFEEICSNDHGKCTMVM
jgi:NAD(P)H-hydrate epimerase